MRPLLGCHPRIVEAIHCTVRDGGLLETREEMSRLRDRPAIKKNTDMTTVYRTFPNTVVHTSSASVWHTLARGDYFRKRRKFA